MQQEARNTETHGRSWSDKNLRNKAVLFVSAGSLEPNRETDDQIKSDSDREEPGPIEVEEEALDEDDVFFLDSRGQAAVNTGLENPLIRSNLSESDDSSEDEVVFTGRRKNAKPVVIETPQNEICEIFQKASALEPLTVPLPPPRVPSPTTVQIEHTESDTKDPIFPPEGDNDPLADYIENIDKDYLEELTGQKLSRDVIDVRRAAAQLNLSPPRLARTRSHSPQLLGRSQHENPDEVESSDGKSLNK